MELYEKLLETRVTPCPEVVGRGGVGGRTGAVAKIPGAKGCPTKVTGDAAPASATVSRGSTTVEGFASERQGDNLMQLGESVSAWKPPQEAFGPGCQRPTSCGFRELEEGVTVKSFRMSSGYFR